MEKSNKFKEELNYIKDEKIRESCRIMLDLLPDYFYEIPASSTGKYHPDYALGDGGLMRHVKVATRIGYELLGDTIIGDNYTSQEKDLMLMGLMLHDGLKSGLKHSKYTQFSHPLLISNYIAENKDKLLLDDKSITFVRNVIETHMGPWTTDFDGNEVLKVPKSKYQKFVHMCDFLASRKFLEVKFDDNSDLLN